jgi:hypothetical protein
MTRSLSAQGRPGRAAFPSVQRSASRKLPARDPWVCSFLCLRSASVQEGDHTLPRPTWQSAHRRLRSLTFTRKICPRPCLLLSRASTLLDLTIKSYFPPLMGGIKGRVRSVIARISSLSRGTRQSHRGGCLPKININETQGRGSRPPQQ